MPTYADLLKEFQKDYNRLIEEQYSQTLTERSDLRLFFINEGKCFTDGNNIIIDPAFLGLFSDRSILEKAEDYLDLSNDISGNPIIALKMCTRAANIHESLHIIYSDFPLRCNSDERSTTEYRLKLLANIANIIEDAFIEAAGSSEYDNLEHFLKWFNVSICFKTRSIQRESLSSYENGKVYCCKRECKNNIQAC